MAAQTGEIILDHLQNLDTEVLKCYQVLAYQAQGVKNDEIAAKMGVNRSTLYRWMDEWKANTVRSQAMQLLLQPKFDAIEAEIRETIEAWPQVLRRMREIASGVTTNKDGNRIDVSPHVSIEAFLVLQQHVVGPALANNADTDAGKRSYADAVIEVGLVDPMAAPAMLRIQAKTGG